jgi:hypothetical protein
MGMGKSHKINRKMKSIKQNQKETIESNTKEKQKMYNSNNFQGRTNNKVDKIITKTQTKGPHPLLHKHNPLQSNPQMLLRRS